MIHGRTQPRGEAPAEFRPITLRRLVQPFLGRGRALVAATLLPVAAIWIGSGWLAPRYQATAQILLEQDQVQLGKIADVMKTPVLPDSATVSNEIAILLSTPILEGAARPPRDARRRRPPGRSGRGPRRSQRGASGRRSRPSASRRGARPPP